MSGVREPHSRKRTAALLAAAVYLPQLFPFVLGPLTECDHCIVSYFRFFPILPGAFFAFPLGKGWLALGASSAAVLVGLYTVLRAIGRHRVGTRFLLALVACLSALNAMGFSMVLRA